MIAPSEEDEDPLFYGFRAFSIAFALGYTNCISKYVKVYFTSYPSLLGSSAVAKSNSNLFAIAFKSEEEQ